MKVTATMRTLGHIEIYHWKSIEFCCPKMGDAFINTKIVHLSISYDIPGVLLTGGKVPITIFHCPFCGARINIDILDD